MFGRRFFGGRFYGPRYWGDGGTGTAEVLEGGPRSGTKRKKKADNDSGSSEEDDMLDLIAVLVAAGVI